MDVTDSVIILDIERVRKMIADHEKEFGEKPNMVVVPAPGGVQIDGIAVHFTHGPGRYTIDAKRSFSHE